MSPTPPPFDPPHEGHVRGWKVARVVLADDATIRFAGLAAPSVRATFYDAEGVAHCAKGAPHKAPGFFCTCGFHLAPDIDALTSMYDDWDQAMFVLVEVEAHGVIVEHDVGLRAEAQRVLGVSFADRCAWCAEPSTALIASRSLPDRKSRFGTAELAHVVPACAGCAQTHGDGTTFTLADIAGSLGVEVSTRTPMPPRSGVLHLRPEAPARDRREAAATLIGMMVAVSVTIVTAATGRLVPTIMALLTAIALAAAVTPPYTRLATKLRAAAAFTAVCTLLAVTAAGQPPTEQWFTSSLDAFAELPSDPFAAQQHVFDAQLHVDVLWYGSSATIRGAVVRTQADAPERCVVVDLTATEPSMVFESGLFDQCRSVAADMFSDT